MDEILLYLSLRNYGEWLAVYDSLQKKEELKIYDIKKAVNEVDASWITLISSDYPKNLKTIYKPPFGVFVYGKEKLLNLPMITIYGKVNNDNWLWLEQLKKQNVNFLYCVKDSKEIKKILSFEHENNIFYVSELKAMNNDKLLADENFIMENAIISEIWEKSDKVDYSNQWPERLFLGLSLKALIVSDLKLNELRALADYCEKENIVIGCLKPYYNDKVKNVLKSNNVIVIENEQTINQFLKVNN